MTNVVLYHALGIRGYQNMQAEPPGTVFLTGLPEGTRYGIEFRHLHSWSLLILSILFILSEM
jgi:hypothetical protein